MTTFKKIARLRSLCSISQFRFKSLSSHEWLKRRDKDIYCDLAKVENYRCRSAFKLLEINEKYNILHNGMVALDLGAAPGSWTQVLVKKTNADGKDERRSKGKVIAVDRLPIYPVEGATILSKMDFTLEKSHDQILQALGGSQVNVVVSDMAPNATGVKALDQEAIFNLVMCALKFSLFISAKNATCLIKTWDGDRTNNIYNEFKRFFNQVNHVRPKATQTESSELFILGRGFKGLQAR